MGSLGRTMAGVGARLRRKPQTSSTWIMTGSALLRAFVLALGAYLVSLSLTGAPLFVAVLTGCALIVVLPTYLQAKRATALHELSLTDALTGLGNRRALNLRLQEEVARCSRGGDPVTVMMIDVDKLKAVNDEEGHTAGDRALQTVSHAIRRSTRMSDVVGRWGGDEFLVIASDTDERAALALAERIIAAAERDCVVRPGRRRVGLSIGIATATTKNLDIRELLESADRAMYEAKDLGGNRAIKCSDLGLDNLVSLHSSRSQV